MFRAARNTTIHGTQPAPISTARRQARPVKNASNLSHSPFTSAVSVRTQRRGTCGTTLLVPAAVSPGTGRRAARLPGQRPSGRAHRQRSGRNHRRCRRHAYRCGGTSGAGPGGAGTERCSRVLDQRNQSHLAPAAAAGLDVDFEAPAYEIVPRAIPAAMRGWSLGCVLSWR